jgi:hypothetical protein
VNSTPQKPGLPPDYELLVATPAAIRWLILALLAFQLGVFAYMTAAVLAASRPAQIAALAVILLLFLHFARLFLRVGNWLSGAVARDGLYLPDKESGTLVLVPWSAIGTIQPGRAGLMIRGLQVELRDAALAERLANTRRDDAGLLLVRLPTQLMNRARLLQRIEEIRQPE